jgi:16S rRNA (uracil1498-N3)-methyltransferase
VVEPLFISPISSDVSVGSKIKISGAEAKHALSVKRMQPGEAIAVSDGQGTKLRGKVTLVTKEFLFQSGNTIRKSKVSSAGSQLQPKPPNSRFELSYPK